MGEGVSISSQTRFLNVSFQRGGVCVLVFVVVVQIISRPPSLSLDARTYAHPIIQNRSYYYFPYPIQMPSHPEIKLQFHAPNFLCGTSIYGSHALPHICVRGLCRAAQSLNVLVHLAF